MPGQRREIQLRRMAGNTVWSHMTSDLTSALEVSHIMHYTNRCILIQLRLSTLSMYRHIRIINISVTAQWSTHSFLIWMKFGRSRWVIHGGMSYGLIQGQGHWGPKVVKMAEFNICLVHWYAYTVWVKKNSPLRFSEIFFQNGWEFLINFYTPIMRSFLH